ncbi:MAG: DNA-methyltransferase [Planctomycetota bacterium]
MKKVKPRRNPPRVLEPGRSFFLWGGYANIGNMPPALADCELYLSQAIIWVREHPVLTRKDYMGNHEWCFYGWRDGAGHQWLGPNNATDVWRVKKVNPAAMVHLTEKPVELAVRAIQYSSRLGKNVLDPFARSGSTLIACEPLDGARDRQRGRRAFLMEVDALYPSIFLKAVSLSNGCDVIVQRWEQFSGQEAGRVAAAEEATHAEG